MFLLGSDRFALPCARVREIVTAVAVQSLPKGPRIVEGVVNVRGTVVPVLDVRSRFRHEPRALHHDQHFILAHTRGRLVALRVDRAVDVITVDASAIRPASVVPGVDHVAGIAAVDDGLVVIQDLDRFLALEEAAAMDAALADAAGADA